MSGAASRTAVLPVVQRAIEESGSDAIDAVVSLVPDTWVGEGEAAAARAAYRQYLLERLMPPRTFLDEALRVR